MRSATEIVASREHEHFVCALRWMGAALCTGLVTLTVLAFDDLSSGAIASVVVLAAFSLSFIFSGYLLELAFKLLPRPKSQCSLWARCYVSLRKDLG